MTEKTISDLPAASALDGTELVELEQGGNSRKSSLASVRATLFSTVYDVIASRTDSTWYQNTHGRPMMVTIRVVSASSRALLVSPDGGTTLIEAARWPASVSPSLTAMVPAGWYYRLSGAGAATWIETY